MNDKASDDDAAKMANDIDTLNGLHHLNRRATSALEIAVLTLVDTLENMLPGTRGRVVADMRTAAEREWAFMRYLQSASDEGDPTDKDIARELMALEYLITKLERPNIKD
ncbi:hypothetical protein ACEUZ9_001579 [Paracoccus litorisediminis]|uniref:Uncharacterized protein n=1 Tax=Paracoccus litorisediminis TaxID=2006130 RepID=A0A844HFX1_9RHOB|nr:hypothetical protein [Paracoccus litorisediminis]MTH57658.1 hypothetical protein [Paracoccus litorisediminis]